MMTTMENGESNKKRFGFYAKQSVTKIIFYSTVYVTGIMATTVDSRPAVPSRNYLTVALCPTDTYTIHYRTVCD